MYFSYSRRKLLLVKDKHLYIFNLQTTELRLAFKELAFVLFWTYRYSLRVDGSAWPAELVLTTEDSDERGNFLYNRRERIVPHNSMSTFCP